MAPSGAMRNPPPRFRCGRAGPATAWVAPVPSANPAAERTRWKPLRKRRQADHKASLRHPRRSTRCCTFSHHLSLSFRFEDKVLLNTPCRVCSIRVAGSAVVSWIRDVGGSRARRASRRAGGTECLEPRTPLLLDARNASPVAALEGRARRHIDEIAEKTRARVRRTSAAEGAHRIQGCSSDPCTTRGVAQPLEAAVDSRS
jgi:hypothetical protein